MTILGFINKIFNTNEVTEATKVSDVNHPAATSNTSIFVDDKKDSNIGEQVQITKSSRESVYKKIEDICVEYRIPIDDAKEAQLLEGILGCTPEHIANISDEELDKAIDALKFALTYKSFKLPWQKRTKEDLTKIRENANDRYIYKSTGRNFFSNIFREHGDLEERLSRSGLLPTDKTLDKCTDEELMQAVDIYFTNILADAIASNDAAKLEEACKQALKIYGDILIDTEDSRQRELLTAAIGKLSIQGRETAAKISLASCGADTEARAQVARGINTNYMSIACTPDAMGEYMEPTAATNISNMSYLHMADEDTKAAYEKLNADAIAFFAQHGELIEELKQKDPSNLTDEEKAILVIAKNGYYSQYAGALTGIEGNVNISAENKVKYSADINNTINNVAISQEVYQSVAEYIVEYPNSVAANSIDNFIKIMDAATNGEFSKEFNDILLNVVETYNDNARNKLTAEKNDSEVIIITKFKAEKVSNQVSDIDEMSTLKNFGTLQGYFSTNSKENKTSSFISNPFITMSKTDDKLVKLENVPKETKELITAVRAGAESFEVYLENNGVYRTVTEVFNNINYIPEAWVIEKTMRIYENFSSKEQADTLKRANNAALSKLLPHTNKEALYNLEGETFTNFYATKQVENAIQDVREKESA